MTPFEQLRELAKAISKKPISTWTEEERVTMRAYARHPELGKRLDYARHLLSRELEKDRKEAKDGS